MLSNIKCRKNINSPITPMLATIHGIQQIMIICNIPRLAGCGWWEGSDWEPPNFQIHPQIGRVLEVRTPKNAGSGSQEKQLVVKSLDVKP